MRSRIMAIVRFFVPFSHFSEGFPVPILTYLPRRCTLESYAVKYASLQWSFSNISLFIPSPIHWDNLVLLTHLMGFVKSLV